MAIQTPPDSFVLVLGSVTIDLNDLYGVPLPPSLGGSGTAVSRALSRLGMHVVWLTPAAEPDHDRLRELASAHLTVVPLPSRMTLCYRNIYPDRRKPMKRLQKVDAFAEPYRWSDVAGLAETHPALIVAGPLTPADLPLQLLVEASRRTGKPFWLDPQGYVRNIGRDGMVSYQAWTPDPAQLQGIELLKADWQEALCMLGRPDECRQDPPSLEQLALDLRAQYHVPVVAITAGEEGAVILEPGHDRAFFQKAYPVLGENSDPTGSGDIFLAGLVFARHLLGKSWRESARIAAVAAGLNCEHHGVYGPSRDELDDRLLRLDRA
jgi:sugar/nucleoside kinase (ribokinase family)